MPGTQIQITDAGRAALVAPGNTGSAARQVTQIGLGTAAFSFEPGMKTIPSELKRITTFGGDQVAADTIHVLIQDDSKDQYTLFAFGLYLDNGVLFGVFVQTEPILEKAPSSMMLLAADAVFKSIDVTNLTFGPATFLNPPATPEQKGVIEIATQAEVDAGTDDTRAITPKNAATCYMPFIGGRFTGPVMVSKGTGAISDDGSSVLQVFGDSRTTGKSLFGTAAIGPALLQVGGSARFTGPIWRGLTNAIRVGSSDSAGIQNAGTSGDASINNARFSADTVGPAINLGKSRGTSIGKQAAVKADDALGSVYFCGSDGDRTLMGAAIVASAASGFTSTSHAALLDFRTVPNGAVASILRMRITADGRVLYGNTDDNGQDMIQSRGSIHSSCGIRSAGCDANGSGAQFRAVGTDYGVMIRNDNKSASFLSTKKGDAYGTFNDYRPLTWSLDTGAVSIDGSGAGTTLGGCLHVYGNLEGSGVGYFAGGSNQAKSYGSGVILGADSGGGVVLKCATADVNMKMWDVQSNARQLNMRAIDDEWTRGVPFLTATREDKSNAIRSLALVPDGGRVLIGAAKDDMSILLNVGGLVAGSTPPAGDSSNKLITSAWFSTALLNAQIGQIIWEARTAARAGYLKLNGAELKREDYPALWAYAQSSGGIVSEADWRNGRNGCFSTGDDGTTFRLPDLRGEFIRCWDDGRGVDANRQIGSFQNFANARHSHGASASAVGDHSHSAWTDAQGWHGHGVNDPGHAHSVRMGRVGVVATSYGQGWGPYNWDRQDMHGTEGALSNISIAGDGNHGHNVGIGGAGNHTHAITVNGDGGNEARPRNIALQPMIRAY